MTECKDSNKSSFDMITVTSKSHSNALVSGMQCLRSSGVLFDFTLVAQDESVQVHKVVLASSSDYFRALFCGDMRESRELRVVLKEVTGTTLKALVEFAYTGTMELSMDNIEEIVSGASYFQMTCALELCCEFLEMILSKDNVVDVLRIAGKHYLKDLEKKAENFLLQNFQNLEDDVFVKLSGEQLVDLLERNDLVINSEFELFQKTLFWIESQPCLPNEEVCDILEAVRYPLMSAMQLTEVAQRQIMTSSQRLKGLLIEGLEYHKDVIRQPLLQTRRTQVRSQNQSYIIAANDKLFRTSEKESVTEMKQIDEFQKHYHLQQIAIVDNFLYVCCNLFIDDLPYHTCFHRYDPRFNIWQHLPPLMATRFIFPLVPLNGSIFAIGGVEESTVEAFSIKENRWEMRAPLSHSRTASAGVAYLGRVFVSGGRYSSDLTEPCYSDFICYNPEGDHWESKAPMIKERAEHQMTVISDRIYAFGGSWRESANTVEYYSPDVNQWTMTKTNLKSGIHGLIVVDRDVHIFTIHMKPSPNSEEIAFYRFDPETETAIMSFKKEMTNITFQDLMEIILLSAVLTLPHKPPN